MMISIDSYKSRLIVPDTPTKTILSYLAENRNVDNTITSISVNLKIAKHQVVGPINYLASAGLIERAMVDTDYGDTIKCIYITEKGLIEISKMSQIPDVLPIEFVTKAFTITVQESVKALSQVIMENIDNGCSIEDVQRICEAIKEWDYPINYTPSEVYTEMVNLIKEEQEWNENKKEWGDII